MTITIPKDFRAVVFTPPAHVDKAAVTRILNAALAYGLPKIAAHRIIHMHQVEFIDSAAVAGLLTILQAAETHGKKFVMCEPPPVVRGYLEVYGAGTLLRDNVLTANEDGTYEPGILPFVPPFVPAPAGRYDVYENGAVTSLEVHDGRLRKIAPVNLDDHPPKPPARAGRMTEVRKAETREIAARTYVLLRRHRCGEEQAHELFSRLRGLHRWYQGKGVDFTGLEIWVADQPAGEVVERLTFRDRPHYEQFQTLLKIDQAWKDIAPGESAEDTLYYQYK